MRFRVSSKSLHGPQVSVLTDSISAFRQHELREAIEESPLSTLFNAVLQQLFGFPSYLIRNAAGQKHYPKGTNRESLFPVQLFKQS